MIRQNIVLKNIISENIAHIEYPNFGGAPTKYNPRGGTRTFDLVFDNLELADKLAEEGWNIKFREYDSGTRRAKLNVKVALNVPKYPVNLLMLSSEGKNRITDKNIEILDQATFQDIDLIIRPREWNDDDGSVKIKAYLQTMFVVLYEDELVKKFNSLSAE